MARIAAGLVILFLVILVAKPGVALEISCASVVSEVAPCLDYITDKTDQPSRNCCNAMKELDGHAKTIPDWQAACECIKASLVNRKYDAPRIVQLPQQCGLSVHIPPDLDCSKISA
ncbi:non-specific lipid-transfer protein 1-like [Jatropha curcas]|nr:non-specific lipid-transfer protein 1-like [Jatropha curcas]